jgi:hypothetical protein
LTAHFNFFKSPVRLAVREYLLDYRQHGLGKVKDRLRLQTRKRGDFELRLPKFQLAMRALATCKLDLHRSLGIDDAVLKSMAVKPQGFASTVLDLPAFDDALNFTVLYWVTVEGRVEQCRLLVPSGIKSFDKTICPRIEQKARLTPAKNAQGVPIRAPVYESPKVRRMRI